MLTLAIQLKHIKAIKDPDAFQLLGDRTRRKIIFLLRVKEMTVSQIAGELNLTPQAVYHHIKKLLKADLVEVSKEVRVGHIIESYYRATAETFVCSVGKAFRNKEMATEQRTTVLKALNKIGFKLIIEEEKVSRLVDLSGQLENCCGSGKYEDAIAELNEVDFLAKQTVQEYAEILAMSDQELQRRQKIKKDFRETLLSLSE